MEIGLIKVKKKRKSVDDLLSAVTRGDVSAIVPLILEAR